MDLLRLVMREYRLAFSAVMLASLVNAGLGVGVIAFINQRLIATDGATLAALPEFFALVVLLLVIALAAQLGLTVLGHHFVYDLRARLVRRILATDIARLETIGASALLASLSADVRNVTIAFVRLPELVQGVVLTAASVLYLGWLSWPILLLTAVWIGLTMAVGAVLVRRVYAHLRGVREAEDALYADYETILHGRKELALNRARAADLYTRRFVRHATDYRDQIIRADTYHLSANNWANIMMLGAIGLVFFLANALGWATSATAATYALTLLFLRTPMIQAVGALPTLLNAQVAFDKLAALQLAPAADTVDIPEPVREWQRLALKDVCFHYDKGGFTIGPVDLSIRRGELVFIIGGNGSGKTTLARLMTGLYMPDQGTIAIDDRPVTADSPQTLQSLFSAVFTDFHLFDRLLGAGQEDADDALIAEWIERLELGDKLSREGAHLLDTGLSQGQRKRLALLIALAESRQILLLDEWAADQDPVFRRVFYRELLPALAARGHTVIAISHDDGYFVHADRLLEMHSGRLVELTGAERQAASHDAIARISRPAG